VYAFNLNTELLWTFFGLDFNINVSIKTDGLVILRNLEVLRHIWIEVILTSKAAIRRNLAVKGKSNQDG